MTTRENNRGAIDRREGTALWGGLRERRSSSNLTGVFGMLLAAILLSALLFSCGGGEGENAGKETEGEFTIAEQYGLAYAPLQLMRERGMLEEELGRRGIDGVEVEWRRLGNTAAIREAILGGRVDAGFMGIPPFLIGFDAGMEWRMVTGLSKAPLGLTSWVEEIRSLSDFERRHRIALPQPGSIQHILLSMACERELGEASALDSQLVTMKHPDGMQALLSEKDIHAHFTSPPYIMEELDRPGIHRILSGREAMGGEFTFIVGAVTEKAMEEMPEVHEAFVATVREAADRVESNPAETARLLSEEYGIEEGTLERYLRRDDLTFGPEIEGVETFIDFMYRHGYLDSRLSLDEVMTRSGSEGGE